MNLCVYGMAGEYTGHGVTQKDMGKSISPCPAINKGNATNLPDNQLNLPPFVFSCMRLYPSKEVCQRVGAAGM